MTDEALRDLGFSWRRLDFLAEGESCAPDEAQQLMARLTGNYNRGNERLARHHPRNR